MADSTRWEYRYETVGSVWSRPKDEELEATLNEWGEEGWEVVNFVVESNKLIFLARRPLTLTSRRRRSLPGD
jgi:hypothetical protein